MNNVLKQSASLSSSGIIRIAIIIIGAAP